MQMYDITIQHLPDVNADAMSRRPCVQDGCKHCTKVVAQQESSTSEEEGPEAMTQCTHSDSEQEFRVCSTNIQEL